MLQALPITKTKDLLKRQLFILILRVVPFEQISRPFPDPRIPREPIIEDFHIHEICKILDNENEHHSLAIKRLQFPTVLQTLIILAITYTKTRESDVTGTISSVSSFILFVDGTSSVLSSSQS